MACGLITGLYANCNYFVFMYNTLGKFTTHKNMLARGGELRPQSLHPELEYFDTREIGDRFFPHVNIVNPAEDNPRTRIITPPVYIQPPPELQQCASPRPRTLWASFMGVSSDLVTLSRNDFSPGNVYHMTFRSHTIVLQTKSDRLILYDSLARAFQVRGAGGKMDEDTGAFVYVFQDHTRGVDSFIEFMRESSSWEGALTTFKEVCCEYKKVRAPLHYYPPLHSHLPCSTYHLTFHIILISTCYLVH